MAIQLQNESALGTMATGYAGIHATNETQIRLSVKDPAGNDLVVPSMIIACQASNWTGTNDTNAHPVFNTSTNGTLTVPANTTYIFDALYHITTVGTASHTIGTLFGGTATLTSIAYSAQSNNPATEVAGADQTLWCTAATVQVLTTAVATATYNTLKLKGVVRINAAGTFIPQFQYGGTAPGTAPTILAGTYFMMFPVGANTMTTWGLWS